MRAIEVRHEAGDRFRITVGRHEVVVDQPAAGDAGPTPTELFVASLASCAAFYARRFLERRDLANASLRVAAACAMSADHSRVSENSRGSPSPSRSNRRSRTRCDAWWTAARSTARFASRRRDARARGNERGRGGGLKRSTVSLSRSQLPRGEVTSTAKYTDCAQGHDSVRITGNTDDEFVTNVQAHLLSVHSSMPMPGPEQILAMAKQT